MRDRRLLSARGHPDRLRESEGQAEEGEEKDVSGGKSRMQGIPRSFRNKRADRKK